MNGRLARPLGSTALALGLLLALAGCAIFENEEDPSPDVLGGGGGGGGGDTITTTNSNPADGDAVLDNMMVTFMAMVPPNGLDVVTATQTVGTIQHEVSVEFSDKPPPLFIFQVGHRWGPDLMNPTGFACCNPCNETMIDTFTREVTFNNQVLTNNPACTPPGTATSTVDGSVTYP
jgi:hypothetical protein